MFRFDEFLAKQHLFLEIVLRLCGDKMEFELSKAFQVANCRRFVQLLLIQTNHVATVAEVPFQNKLVGQRVPVNLVRVVVGGNHLCQNMLQTVLFHIIPYPQLVGTLHYQLVVFVVIQLHPLDFLVQRLRIL